MPLTPSEFWNGKLPVGTRCRDAVTGDGPYYILPHDPDSQGRIAVYSGLPEEGKIKCMGYHRMWCAALKPEVAPIPRDWDKLGAFAAAGGAVWTAIFVLVALLFGLI